MRAGSAGGQGLPAFYFGEMKKAFGFREVNNYIHNDYDFKKTKTKGESSWQLSPKTHSSRG